MKIQLAFLLTVLLVSGSHAQWPTSTLTDSALSINYGFEANAVVFDDGSVVFSHGYDRWQFLTKFDARGYRRWPNPILINNQDSCNGGNWPMVSDGAKGIIMILGDRRGATFDSMGRALTNPIWMERVDSNGIESWGAGGVQAAPNEGAATFAWLTTDGAGGAILITMESSWAFPGALNFSRVRARRIGRDGEVRWVRTLDSSAVIDLYFLVNRVSRAGRLIYIDGIRYFQPQVETYLTRIIDTSGIVPAYSPWIGYRENVPFKDSVLFSRSGDAAIGNQVTKLAANGDTIWSSYIPPATGAGCRFLAAMYSIVPSSLGGAYYLRACNDSMYHLGSTGILQRHHFPGISSMAGAVFSDGRGGIVLATQTNLTSGPGLAQRYDSLGTPLWGSSPIIYRSDPQNAYFGSYWGDKNGGIIATLWSPSRGLCAQHTGRYGLPGIVPVGETFGLPSEFTLSQNFPNPFNPSTRIRYTLSSRQLVSVEIYDLLGRKIVQLVNEVKEVGSYEVDWNAHGVSSGVYLCRMRFGDKTIAVRKMVLVH